MGPEAELQAAIIQWAALRSGRWPELALLFHIPNGGSRNKIEAVHLKQQGVKAGVPDLFLPVPRGGWAGLFIELKAGRNKPTRMQNQWLHDLIRQGYLAVVCNDVEQTCRLIEEYLRGEKKVSE